MVYNNRGNHGPCENTNRLRLIPEFHQLRLCKKTQIQTTALLTPRKVEGIDRKDVKTLITLKTTLDITIEGKTFKQRFYVMPLGDTEAILGLSWLQEADPKISWTDMTLQYRDQVLQGKAGETTPELPSELREYESVFDAELFDQLPEHREYDCAIDLKADAILPRPAKAFPMSDSHAKQLDEYLNKELATGKIRESKSPIAAPCFYVPKADGSLRLVIDYRKLNEITIGNQFPLPIQSDLLEKVREAKIFSKLDLRWGYNNIRIKEGDEWKTAFKTKNRLYEYVVMPFGLKIAPAVFQRFMNKIFEDLIDVYVIVYLDDILIYSKNREEHTNHVLEVLRRLKENNLFLKLSKCFFYVTTVTYIGIIITPEGVSMEKEKIKAIQEWPVPRTVKQIQSFLGVCQLLQKVRERL